MAPRTKSCATCRKKRIKCDATVPECLMCTRTGRQCPGIPDGPMIIDMTKKAKYGMQKRKPAPSPKSWEVTTLVTSTQKEVVLNRISDRALVTEAFYGRFLAYFTSDGDQKEIGNRWTWLHRLPFLYTDGTSEALVLAIQATASAYCAAENNSSNLALTRHAWDLYGEALHKHSRVVAQSRIKQKITVHMVSTSVLFSIFEAIFATNVSAYRSHIYGAVRMMEVAEAKQCMDGILCEIFWHLRTQMAFVHLTGGGGNETVEVMDILRRTLDYSTIPMFQRLMTQVTTLIELYVVQEDDKMDQTLDLVTYMQVKEEVNKLWQEYVEVAVVNGEQLSWKDALLKGTQYRNAFTALTISYFESARVLLAVLGPKFAASFVDLTDHYAAILEASRFLRTHDIGCAYMRMGTPLLLVALHAPKEKQRAQAMACFINWGGGGMKGISMLALETIFRRQKQKQYVAEVASTKGATMTYLDGYPTPPSDTGSLQLIEG